MEKLIAKDNFTSGIWSEKIMIITNEFEITGYVFMPKTGKKNRILSDILNSNRRFVAVKDCKIKNRATGKVVDKYNFLQVNLDCVTLMSPIE